MTPTQDATIKNAIEQLEVPAPRPGFFEEVDAMVAVETILPEEQSHPRSKTRLASYMISPVAIAAAIALIFVINQPTEQQTPQVAQPTTTSTTTAPITEVTQIDTKLVAEVVAKATATFGTAKAVAGTATIVRHAGKTPGGETVVASKAVKEFKVAANGDFWWEDQDGNHAKYSAADAELVNCVVDAGVPWVTRDRPQCVVYQGLTSPDPKSTPELGFGTLAAVLRGAAMADRAEAVETEFQGRDVWKLTMSYIEQPAGGPEGALVEATMYVDRASGFPLYASTVVNGTPDTEVTVGELHVNPAFPEDTFKGWGDGPNGFGIEQGSYTRVGFDAVERVAGYKPIVPTVLPPGFKRAEVSVNASTGVAVITYRHGLEFFTVTSRPAATASSSGSDPLGTPTETVLMTSAEPLTKGVFANRNAHYTLTNHDVRAWVMGTRYVVTVAGDLSFEQLADVLESMEQG